MLGSYIYVHSKLLLAWVYSGGCRRTTRVFGINLPCYILKKLLMYYKGTTQLQVLDLFEYVHWRDNALFMKPFKHNVMKHDFLDTKKSRDHENLVVCTVLITRILVIPRGRPSNVGDAYVHIKPQKDMHHFVGWKEDDASPEKWWWTCVPSPILIYSSRTPALTASSSQLVPSILQSVPFLSSHVHNDVVYTQVTFYSSLLVL